jgi:hypothetical protein
MRVHPAGSLAERLDQLGEQDDFVLQRRGDDQQEAEAMEHGENGEPEIAPIVVERNVFDPGFLEVRPREDDEQNGTRAQQADMLEAVADARDEATHDKLKNSDMGMTALPKTVSLTIKTKLKKLLNSLFDNRRSTCRCRCH